MSGSRAALTTILLWAVAACAGSRTPLATPAPQASDSATVGDASAIAVQIDNQNFNSMNIYLLSGGQRLLLGQAEGLARTTLTIAGALTPADLRVRLLAEPIGGRGAITTPALLVPRGQRVFWTIGSDPAMSTASAG